MGPISLIFIWQMLTSALKALFKEIKRERFLLGGAKLRYPDFFCALLWALVSKTPFIFGNPFKIKIIIPHDNSIELEKNQLNLFEILSQHLNCQFYNYELKMCSTRKLKTCLPHFFKNLEITKFLYFLNCYFILIILLN